MGSPAASNSSSAFARSSSHRSGPSSARARAIASRRCCAAAACCASACALASSRARLARPVASSASRAVSRLGLKCERESAALKRESSSIPGAFGCASATESTSAPDSRRVSVITPERYASSLRTPSGRLRWRLTAASAMASSKRHLASRPGSLDDGAGRRLGWSVAVSATTGRGWSGGLSLGFSWSDDPCGADGAGAWRLDGAFGSGPVENNTRLLSSGVTISNSSSA